MATLFSESICLEASEADGLLVLARGLGIPEIVRLLISSCSEPDRSVVVLNFYESHAREYDCLVALNGGKAMQVIETSTLSSARSEIYKQGALASMPCLSTCPVCLCVCVCLFAYMSIYLPDFLFL